MAELIRMPKMSDTMEQGVISKWLKKVGDTVQAGDILAEVETDKATMELEAYEDGTLLHIGIQEKEAVLINGIIAIVGEPDEDIKELIATTTSPATEAPLAAEPPSLGTPTNSTINEIVASKVTTEAHVPTGKLLASPLAKKIAKDKGHDLSRIQGTGDGGRIIKRDLANLSISNTQYAALPVTMVGEEGYTEVPISKMRHTIAKVLTTSKTHTPHFYLTVSINMDQIIATRASINDYAATKISFNDYVVKATATALRKHPTINTAWLEDKIRYNQHIHIGVAMAVEEGLLVPLVRFADHKSLTQIATEVKSLSVKAHEKKLQPKDYEGATFTISNLGMLGIDSFTAIINPPAACILAVGAIQQVPIVKEGNITPGNVMKVTLSCDHRLVDGAVGAAFLNTLKTLLENPIKMLI